MHQVVNLWSVAPCTILILEFALWSLNSCNIIFYMYSSVWIWHRMLFCNIVDTGYHRILACNGLVKHGWRNSSGRLDGRRDGRKRTILRWRQVAGTAVPHRGAKEWEYPTWSQVHVCGCTQFVTLATVVAATLQVFRLACIVWLCTLTLQTISAEKAAALFSHTWQGVSSCNYITDDYLHTIYPTNIATTLHRLSEHQQTVTMVKMTSCPAWSHTWSISATENHCKPLYSLETIFSRNESL